MSKNKIICFKEQLITTERKNAQKKEKKGGKEAKKLEQ